MLTKFSEQLSGNNLSGPPYVIKASDLDGNFKMLSPRSLDGNNSPYRLDWGGENGWVLHGRIVFDVCENGKPVKYRFFAQKEPA